MNLSTLSVTDLLAQRSAIDAEIFKQTGGSASGGAASKKAKGEKKPSARTGKSTVYGDFSSKIQKEHVEAIKAFKEANPDLKGAHMTWVGTYKKEHLEEYEAFKAEWDVAHPKVEEEAEAAPASDGDAEKAEVKPKKVLSPEHLAKLKAGREAAKAKKDAEKAAAEEEGRSEAPISVVAAAAAIEAKKPVKKAKKADAPAPVAVVAPVVAPQEEGELTEELPFKLGVQTFIRLGTSKPDGNHIWASTDLWMNKKGKRGAYAGELMEDGSINADAEEPTIE